MEWKLFGSTFALIFLAELGDKTQLAAFAATAGSKSPWSIFLGASVALVLSTLLAVLFGDTIQKFVPQHYLKLGAGGLFVIFGILLLIAGLRPKAAEAASSAPVQTARPGVVTRMVLSMAEEFEQASSADYAKMASEAQDPALAALLRSLAAEEAGHLRAVRDTLTVHGPATWGTSGVRQVHAMAPSMSQLNTATADVLSQAIRHERATAGFYRELAATAPLDSLRKAFAALAAQEESHAVKLESFEGCAKQLTK
jgi:rubrerythrin